MQLSGHKNVQSILSYSTVSQKKKTAEHYLHAHRTELGRNSSPVCSCTPKKREQEFDELTYTTCRTQQSMQASSTAAPFSFLGVIIRVVHISAAINTLKSIAHSFSARGKPQQSSQNNQTYWFRISLPFVNSSMRVLMSNKKWSLGFKIKINFVFTRVTHNSHTTDIPVALEFPIELEFRNVDFCGGRKTGEPGEKPSEQAREPTTNSTHLCLHFCISNF